MFGEGDDPRRHPQRMEAIARRYAPPAIDAPPAGRAQSGRCAPSRHTYGLSPQRAPQYPAARPCLSRGLSIAITHPVSAPPACLLSVPYRINIPSHAVVPFPCLPHLHLQLLDRRLLSAAVAVGGELPLLQGLAPNAPHARLRPVVYVPHSPSPFSHLPSAFAHLLG